MNGQEQSRNHQILLSPSVTHGLDAKLIAHPNADISVATCESAGRLTGYDLVILQYDEFGMLSGRINPYKQIFDKQMLEALEQGVTFCFIHHNETFPGEWKSYGKFGYIEETEVSRCYSFQAGFRWIRDRNIRINRHEHLVIDADVKRGEFNKFLTKWGASYNYFRPFENGSVDDVLYEINGFQIGFTLDWSQGMIIYLPFQANTVETDDLKEAILCLLDSLLTYKAKRLREIPEWAKEPLFENEKHLTDQRSHILDELNAVEAKINPFNEIKSLLVASEHKLEIAVPDFISERFAIKTERNERFVEDFWLIDEKSARFAICEVKSVTKGFKKGAIYDVYNHREKNDLPETFPALLFVNCNLQAGSWAKKDTPIQAADVKIASEHNVLIVRIEDLVRIWDAISNEKLSRNELINIFTSQRGWCEFKHGKIKIHH